MAILVLGALNETLRRLRSSVATRIEFSHVRVFVGCERKKKHLEEILGEQVD